MENKLENSIMERIKTGQVKLRSKYIFIAEKIGLGTALALSTILAILFFNLILFYMKETDNLKYLSFGRFGIFAFLETFPYALVIGFILLIVLSGYLLTKGDDSYKKPFGYTAIGLIVIIMIFGGILTYTNIAKAIEWEAHMDHQSIGMIFRPLINTGPDMRSRGISGMVFEAGGNYLILKTPAGLRNVNLEEIGANDLPQIEKDQFVIAVGNNEGNDFIAQKIRIINRDEVPSIERGINFRFTMPLNEENIRSLPTDIMRFNEGDKDCIIDCFDSGLPPKECFDKCINS